MLIECRTNFSILADYQKNFELILKQALIISLLSITCTASAQKNLSDLHMRLNQAKIDTAKVNVLIDLAQYFGHLNTDSSIYYAKQALLLSEESQYLFGVFMAYRRIYFSETFIGDYPKAMEFALRQLKAAEKLKEHKLAQVAYSHLDLGFQHRLVGDYAEALSEFQEAFRLQELSGERDPSLFGSAYSQMAIICIERNEKEQALTLAQKGYDSSMQAVTRKLGNNIVLSMAILGTALQANGQYSAAEKYFRQAIDSTIRQNNFYSRARLYKDIAKLFNETGKHDSSIFYALASYQICKDHHYVDYGKDATKILSQVYESQNHPDSALKYLQLTMAANDSLFSQQKTHRIQLLTIDEGIRQQEIVAAQERLWNQIRTYSLLGIVAVFLIIALILFRNNRLQRKAKAQIESAYKQLKSTQAQLVQSEKMASLGQLTAGIAHEIQNPLNFVNNFSDLNRELISEMKSEMNVGNLKQAGEIANDIFRNEEKINQHGKRADAIVRNMLEHSRATAGVKAFTELNSLAEEHLILAYHGFRAKDGSFKIATKTQFDPSLGKINIVPQDIGRVIMNLLNNAFYAVTEKQEYSSNEYEPQVILSTKNSNGYAEITIEDNGNGIDKKNLEKIFQPFFTTKPTGQGTGLGLSLAYDIVKAHGGEIRVKTKEGEGTEFVIHLPLV
jgi:signal transduction histidine kinase